MTSTSAPSRWARRVLVVLATLAVMTGVSAVALAPADHATRLPAAGGRAGGQRAGQALPAAGSPSAAAHTYAPTTTGEPRPRGIPGDLHLVFDDEFDGSALRSVWCPGWFGRGISGPVNETEIGPYLTSNVTVSGGMLHLREDGHDGALVSTNPEDGCHGSDTGFEFTYGVVEFRAWLPHGPQGIANWPALWLDGQHWPTDGELDVLEGLDGAAGVYYHYGTRDEWHPDNGRDVPGDWSGAWHTFTVDWQPDRITFSFDGSTVWETTAGIVDSPMYLIMNDTVHSGDPVTPSTVRVDYVRVWQR